MTPAALARLARLMDMDRDLALARLSQAARELGAVEAQAATVRAGRASVALSEGASGSELAALDRAATERLRRLAEQRTHALEAIAAERAAARLRLGRVQAVSRMEEQAREAARLLRARRAGA